MPTKKDKGVMNQACREHSAVVTRLDHLEATVKKHENELDEGQRRFADFSGDMRVIKILITLAVIAAWLGGVIGPKVWALFGF